MIYVNTGWAIVTSVPPVGMLIMGEAVQMWGQGGYMGNLWILHSTVLWT